jgi:sugar phosphate isomerase/epimerase
MQSRLLPEINGKWQAHPANRWYEEFQIAEKLNLQLIEFIFDLPSLNCNPLISEDGIQTLREVQASSKVKIESICADYFMQSSILDSSIIKSNFSTLQLLVESSKKLDISKIVIPLLDNSSISRQLIHSGLSSEEYFLSIAELFLPALKNLENIEICFETDLEPRLQLDFIEAFNSKNIRVNYDIGNSTGNGFSIEEEFSYYGHLISNVHIKDKKLNGPSIKLGEGDANFLKLKKLLLEYNYSGNIIFETFRDFEGLNIFKEQLSWFQENFIY